jgi:hypothetical protein
MTTKEIALSIMERKGFDVNDGGTLRLVKGEQELGLNVTHGRHEPCINGRTSKNALKILLGAHASAVSLNRGT